MSIETVSNLLASSREENWQSIIELIDTKSYSSVSLLTGHPAGVISIDISWNGQFISAASTCGIATVWDIQSSSILSSLSHDATCVGVEFDRSLDRLLCNIVETAVVWNWRSAEVLFQITLGNYICARFSMDYATINHVIVSGSLMLCKYDANTGDALAKTVVRSEVSCTIRLNFPDYIVHRSSGVSAFALFNDILVFDDDGGYKLSVRVADIKPRIAFSVDGSKLAAGRKTNDVEIHIDIWNLDLVNNSFSLIGTLSAAGSPCNLSFSPDGSELACGMFGEGDAHCIFSLDTMDVVHRAEPEGKKEGCLVQYFPPATVVLM